jgi:predicted aminopeptidase
MAWGGVVALLGAAVLGLSGCSNLGYYWQSATGHLGIMAAARPVDDWIGDPAAPERLKSRLELARRIRNYAVSELKLPDNPSYRRFADLHRPAAIWNVVAAPRYSLTLKNWCFPVTGCVTYRGYYDLGKARAEAATYASDGYDTSVYPVPAYSTLGFMNWAGGDPLLNTFIYYPEGELARLIFHELAHQVVYAKDDTVFNESFAVSVEQEGLKRWLAAQSDPALTAQFASTQRLREGFRTLIDRTQHSLEALYASDASIVDKRAGKAAAFAQMRADYDALKREWGGYAAYDNWFAQGPNNASLAAVGLYTRKVPEFAGLLVAEGGDLPRFYARVKVLAAMPKGERDTALAAYAPAGDGRIEATHATAGTK